MEKFAEPHLGTSTSKDEDPSNQSY